MPDLLPEELDLWIAEIIDEVEAALDPLLKAGRDPLAFSRFVHGYGWNIEALLGVDPEVLVTVTETVHANVLAMVANLRGTADVEALGDQLIATVQSLVAAADAANSLATAAGGASDLLLTALGLDGVVDPAISTDAQNEAVEHLGLLVASFMADTAEHLLLRYIAGRAPLALAVARVVGLVGPVTAVPLYLDPASTSASGATPLRLPIAKVGVNTALMADALMTPVRFVLRYIDLQSFSSVETFFAALQQMFTDLLAPVFEFLDPGQPRSLTLSLGVDGVSLDVAGVFPNIAALQGDGLRFPLTDGNEFPELVVRIDGATFNWSTPDDANEVVLIDDVLSLVGGNAPSGLSVTLDAVSASDGSSVPRATASLAVAALWKVPNLDDVHDNKLGLSVDASLTAVGDLTFALTATVDGDLVVPLSFPGLNGLALVANEPSLNISFAADDATVEIEVDVDAFGIQLPIALVRRASEGTNGWSIDDAPARVTFALTEADGTSPTSETAPLARLGIGPGPAIDDLRLLDPAGRALRVECDPLFIGGSSVDTGFIIDIDGFEWTFSNGDSLVGGITVERAIVHFPPAFDALDSIELTDAQLGEDGFTGSVTVLFDEAASTESTTQSDHKPQPLFGVLPIALYSVHLEIVDNIPTAFRVEAAIEIPYFKDWVNLTIGIDDAFNVVFRIESSDPDGIVLTKEELLTLTFRSAGFEYRHQANTMELSLSGGFEPLLWGSDGLEWPRLDVTELVLEQDLTALGSGEFEPPLIRFEEAWLDLKELATLDLFGFHFELNRIGVGYIEETDKLWIDLTGSLRLIEFVPIGVGVEGFRVTWPRRIYEELDLTDGELELADLVAMAGKIEVQFDGVYLFFGIPQAVEFEGYIRFIKEAQKIGFAGDVALRVPTSGLAIEAGLMVGINFEEPQPYPFLYVYFGILLPSGIPLGQSGLALKGAKGLFGLNVYPDRTPEQNPYYDWYKRGPIEGAHPTNKWRDQIWSIAFGAGITITTTDGKLLGVQGLLALVLPGPIIFVEGKALIFDGILPPDGPLKALGYFDGGERTVQLNIEASIELVEGVIDINAGLEAFFDFDELTNWHLYLGKDEPLDRRVRANFLQLPMVGWLFQANSYLMIDMTPELRVDTRLGAYIGFEPPSVDLVVASATVRAVIEGNGLITVNPLQFGGKIGLEAVIDVEAFGLSIMGVEASAELVVEGPLPFVVDAVVAAHVDLPIPDLDSVPIVGDAVGSVLDWFEEEVGELPDIPDYIEVEVPFHWEYDGTPTVAPLIRGVTLETALSSEGTEALSPEPDGSIDWWSAPVVALDAHPTVLFDQHVNVDHDVALGGFASGGVRQFESGELVFEPTLRKIEISMLPTGRDPATASPDEWTILASTDDTTQSIWGSFRPERNDQEPDYASRRTLDLWRPNPFDFLTGTVPLAMPAPDAVDDVAGSNLAVALADALAWCDTSPPAEVCITDDVLAKVAADIGFFDWVSEGGAYMRRLSVLDVELVAPVLEVQVSSTNQTEPRLVANGPKRRGLVLTIRFPELVTSVTMTRAKGHESKIDVEARSNVPTAIVKGPDKHRHVAPGRRCASSVTTDVTDDGETITVSGSGGFHCLHLFAEDAVQLAKICWTTLAAKRDADARQVDCERNDALLDRVGSVPSMLTAGAFYKVVVESTTELKTTESSWDRLTLLAVADLFGDGLDEFQGAGRLESATHVFRTEGPPAALAPYVKWTSPQHQQRGWFLDDDVVIRFNRPYVHRLFPDADNSELTEDLPYAIEALLIDADGRVTRGWFHNWTTAASATVFPSEQAFHDAITDAPPSPPDDILEIRRPMLVRTARQLGAADWVPVKRRQPANSSPKWKRSRDGDTIVTAPDATARGTLLASPLLTPDASIELKISAKPVGAIRPRSRFRVANPPYVGIVFGYIDDEHHWQLRIGGASTRHAELVQVAGGAERIVDRQQLRDAADRHAIHVATEVTRDGWRVDATVGSTRLTATAAQAPNTAQFGYLSAGMSATFDALTIGTRSAELTPNSRYRMLLTGGEGGRTMARDTFERTQLSEFWEPNDNWTITNGTAIGAIDNALTLRQPIDDVEIITEIHLPGTAAATLRLRAPQLEDQRTTAYDVTIERTPTGADVTATVLNVQRGVGRLAGRGSAEFTSTDRVRVRVRLVGDSLRVWVFDQLAFDIVLTDADIETFTIDPITAPPVIRGGGTTPFDRGGGTTSFDRRVTPGRRRPRRASIPAPLAWDGALQMLATDGSPRFASIEIRRPELLELGFTTGPFRSVEHMLLLTGPEARRSVDSNLATEITEAHATHRAMADARGELLAMQARYALKEVNRETLEQASQAARVADASHDDVVVRLLDRTGMVDDPTPPPIPTLTRLTDDAGVGHAVVLRLPVDIEPVMQAASADSPFDTLGRSSFQLIDENGSDVPTRWFASSDGSAIVVHATSGPDASPVDLGTATQIRVSYIRHHRDDEATDVSHAFDRPYVLASTVEPTVVHLDLPV